MTTTDLTLDERAEKVLGWKECGTCGRFAPKSHHDNRLAEFRSNFATSIDAQKPLEEMARAQGWWLEAIHELVTGWFLVGWAHDGDVYRRSEAPTEPEARLACLLKVLEARDD